MRAALALFLTLGAAQADGGQDSLSALVEILKQTDDAGFQLDILRGIRDGLKGRQNLKMPAGWKEVAEKLSKSPNPEVRSLAQVVSTSFGDAASLEALRKVLADAKADAAARASALETLLNAKDAALPPVLLGLLDETALRGAAMRALAAYDEPRTPGGILNLYATLDVAERRDALNTLISRLAFARELVGALRKQVVPRKDLTAAIIRQLRDHRDAEIDKWIDQEWGMVRSTPEARAKEIAAMKAMILASPRGEPSRGRALYAKTCTQCHTLFEGGGKVGPELTGANRSDLDYLLSNILDPSALVGKDYQATMIRTKGERLITGIIKEETNDTLTLATENDTVILAKGEIDARKLSEISMMPEGLLGNLSKEEIRDLIAYLQSPFQVPLPAGQETEDLFNGKDLTGWEGDASVWKVENGEIVGKGALKRNNFLFHTRELTDFRLILEVKLVDDKGNSGVQFRSVPIEGGEARGCQADVGPGWWGKLYEESARGLLFPKKDEEFSGEKFVKKGDWNTYEILAVGSKVKIALNGNSCADIDDPKIAVKGRIAVQVHSGEMMEVHFRNLKLELNPKSGLKTVK